MLSSRRQGTATRLWPLEAVADSVAAHSALMATLEAGRNRLASSERAAVSSRMFIAAGVLLGIGLGGFVDGIVLHQMLQWHHMLTATSHHPANTVSGLEANTLWDGIFHAATWLATVNGLWLLWLSRDSFAGPRSGLALFGLILAGWGAFNLVEGIVDHHILTIHHVRDDVADPLPWDLAFLASGVALLGAGTALARHAQRRARL